MKVTAASLGLDVAETTFKGCKGYGLAATHELKEGQFMKEDGTPHRVNILKQMKCGTEAEQAAVEQEVNAVLVGEHKRCFGLTISLTPESDVYFDSKFQKLKDVTGRFKTAYPGAMHPPSTLPRFASTCTFAFF